MRSLSLSNWIVHLADIFLAFYVGQSQWDWTKNGAHIKERLESGITKWVQARADAEVRAEIAALQRLFAKSGFIILLTLVILSILHLHKLPVMQTIMGSLVLIFLIVLIAWTSLDWTFQHKSTLRESLGLRNIVILVIAFVMAGIIAAPHLKQLFINLWEANGWNTPSEGLIYALIIAFMIVSAIFFLLGVYITGWAMFGGLSFVIVGLLYAIGLLSRILVTKMTRQSAMMLVFFIWILIRLIKPLLS
jgi:hypothetical protein